MASAGVGTRIKQTASYLYMMTHRCNHPHEQVEMSRDPARMSNNNDLQESEIEP